MSLALVLGGGGITGIAWEVGILAGLHRAGTDLTAPDERAFLIGIDAVGDSLATG